MKQAGSLTIILREEFGVPFAFLAPRRGVAAALAAFASLFSLHAGAAGRYRELKELVVGWKPIPTSSDPLRVCL